MNVKKRFKFLFPIGLFGMTGGVVLSRVLSRYFKLDGQSIVMSLALLCLSCIIIYLIVIRQYYTLLITLYLTFPAIVIGIGLFLDIMRIMDIGMALFFIMYIPAIIYKKVKLKKSNK